MSDRRQDTHAFTIPLPRSGIVSCVATTGGSPAGKGYQASKDQLLDRLARIKGQVGGIERMVLEDRYCIDVLTQISAVQAALDKVALGLLDGHARTCVVGADSELQEERSAELMAAVGRLMRRG
jgi:CsoR family transcriptional regulator, copper-sensing transcriptional repressor